MSEFGANLQYSTFPLSGAPYNATTAVAINLRQFEKESKAQAEQEYDLDHGPLPDPPADDDPTISSSERTNQKKKRKVRSAIVSRRKSHIYVEKLERELELRDADNASLASQLGVCKEVLRRTEQRIYTLRTALEARSTSALPPFKRSRPNNDIPPTHPTPTIQPTLPTSSDFFLARSRGDSPDDILSISPEEMTLADSSRLAPPQLSNTTTPYHKQWPRNISPSDNVMSISKAMLTRVDSPANYSDCSDGHTSPSPVISEQTTPYRNYSNRDNNPTISRYAAFTSVLPTIRQAAPM